jgi:hypothetical protein
MASPERVCWTYFVLGAALVLIGQISGSSLIMAAGGGFMIGSAPGLINWK